MAFFFEYIRDSIEGMGRLAKQLLIGGIFLSIIGAILFGAYNILVPNPSCSDGIQNQGEEGLDCGAVCGVLCSAPLEQFAVSEAQSFLVSDDLDVLVEIKNPNLIYGAPRLDYRVVVYENADGAGMLGEERISRRGFTYANPLETRYLIVTFPGFTGQVDDIVRFEWEPEQTVVFEGRLSETQIVDFSVLNEQLEVSESGDVSFSADIRNDSTFDFDEVDVSVILFDASNQRIGVGATVIRTLAARQLRAVQLQWPSIHSGTPVRAQVEVSTNVFDNDNFIRTYGGQERFQGF